ncbi:phosphatidylserine decarboxylase family protein [Geobacter sp. FeAm09]|uniref:phosphatidylserine decarboxylase family protein n=1 Tax=Geobacter sp. FeAm09 TaxID=2597769 RepID=UPI0011EDE8E3|nr:phosphatidylserine decarboxylase family protein [Geobacter sp. FeAm09]QEM68105.1 phosphatidylserine decarboxylase family protein [Geobacter sp. FeAm09]
MNNSTPFAREGYPFIICSTGLTFLLAVAAWKWCSLVLAAPAALACVATLFILYFFRNPERTPPGDGHAVVAPADGTVIVAECVPDTPLGTPALKISIFMSVFNVHVNRVPFDGTVVDTFYHRGKFFDARDGRASFENERSGIVLETAGGVRLAFVQIAGLIARRIVCYARTGDALKRGERYGLIRFGSRVDVYLPVDVQPLVKLGDVTVAGETVLGRLA